jgi:putative spermidine/putrescine transport system ATP-binding protein
MQAGRIEQIGPPEELYARPANAFVARFVGFENLVPMQAVAEAGDAVRVRLAGGHALDLARSDFAVPAQTFLFAARPEGLRATPTGPGIPARIGLRTYLGRAYQYRCETTAGELIANGPLSSPLEPGTSAFLAPDPGHCHLLPAEAT